MSNFERKILFSILVIGASTSRLCVGDTLSFEEPASSLEESYRGKYGEDKTVEGPFLESDQSKKVPLPATGQIESSLEPDGSVDDSSKNLISAGIGLSNGFSATLSYLHFYSRYVANEYNLFYTQQHADQTTVKTRSETYGPSLLFLFLGTNPSFFTPLIGAGPSYEVWNRRNDNGFEDRNHAMVANTLIGGNLQLSRRFVLQMGVGRKHYLFNRPAILDGSGDFVAKSERSLQVRFLAQF